MLNSMIAYDADTEALLSVPVTHEAVASVTRLTTKNDGPADAATDSNTALISSICALCLSLVSIYSLALRVLIGTTDMASNTRRLLATSLGFQCLACAALAVCTFLDHWAKFSSMTIACTRSRINKVALALRNSMYARYAVDCVLICTSVSSNVLILARSATGNYDAFHITSLAICCPTICYALLRGSRSATALIAWAFSCAFVVVMCVEFSIWAEVVSTFAIAGSALVIILRIRSLHAECLFLRNRHDSQPSSVSSFVSVSVLNQAVHAATQIAKREAQSLATQVANTTQQSYLQAKAQNDEGVAVLMHSLETARIASDCVQQQADAVAILVAAAASSAAAQARSEGAEAVRLALAESALLAQALAVATIAATERARHDATALAVQVAIATVSATVSAQAKADSATEAALSESKSQAHVVEAASAAKAMLAKQESIDLALVVKAASHSATVLALAKADAEAAVAKRISTSQAESLAAANLASKLLAKQESTALAVEVAATSLTATAFALAKSDAAAEQASRASVAQAHLVAAKSLALTVLAKQEAHTLARQVALVSANAAVTALAKSDSEAASARVKSDLIVQELATANETNALLEVALLRSEKQTLESNSAQLRALMGNVAHDLKTPLQAISMGLEMLRLKYTSSFKVHSRPMSPIDHEHNSFSHETPSLLDNMTASCEFMKMAIHRSIDFTKSSNNIALVPALETVDLEGTVRAQLHMIRSLKPNVQIKMESLPVGMCAMVITDKHWLAENVLCLLSNAVKYSDGGPIGIQFEVTYADAHDTDRDESVAASARASALRITISDTGIGVPETVRATLFQPFQQAQKMAGGTGLGLYSLRKRVEALTGNCGVASRDDGARGSAFWFEFPYRPDVDAMKAAARLLRLESHRSSSPVLSESGDDSDGDRDAGCGDNLCKRVPFPIAALTAFTKTSQGLSGNQAVATDVRPEGDLVAIDVFLSPAKGLLELDLAWAVRRSNLSISCTAGTRTEEPQPLKLRILLIDDAPFIITMATRVLEKKGHIVQSAANGSLGLSMLMETHGTAADFDFVLCDFQMPVMDGFEAVRRYRAFENDAKMLNSDDVAPAKRPPMAIVGMSANSDLASMALAREVGMNALLPKPFSIAQLSGMLNLFR